MNIETRFLLVCLQLIIVLLLHMSVNVDALADMPRRRLSDDLSLSSKYLTLSSTSPVARAYRLHNLKANADILIDGDNRVSATAPNSDERGELGLESVMKDEVVRTRIRDLLAETYLCFNQKGRLVAKPKSRARGTKCEFIERVDPDSGASSFKSAFNPRWHLGFNQKGHALLGPSWISTTCYECFLFYKTTINTAFRKNSSPARLTQRNFDPARHNQRIGQLHPGLHPNFLSTFPYRGERDDNLNSFNSLENQSHPISQTHSRRKLSLQRPKSHLHHPHHHFHQSLESESHLPTSTSSPPPHKLRHRKRKHRHQHGATNKKRPNKSLAPQIDEEESTLHVPLQPTSIPLLNVPNPSDSTL